MRSALFISISGIFLLIVVSCSRGGSGPLAPNPAHSTDIYDFASRQNTGDSNYGHYLFGAWTIEISADRTRYEIIPVRIGTGHFNVRKFLEESPCNTCLSIIGITQKPGGVIDCDIKITHPFVGLDRFTGFDLRGTVIFPSTSGWPSHELTWSSQNDGGAELLNPDGWTTLFNPIDFGSGPPILSYTKGKFATPLENASTLNPFRAFYMEPDRRPFYTGDSVTRTYSIKLPIGKFRFGYVVDVSWAKPDPDPPVNIPDDFPITANCHEAYRISAHTDEGLNDADGTAECEIDVYDWQKTGTISSVSIECPGLFNGKLNPSLETDFGTISRWTKTIANENGAQPGDYPVLISVDDIDPDPLLGFLTAYKIIWAHVEHYVPPLPGDIYVDRDYPGIAGGLNEDGTKDAPFTTITKGVLVAGPGDIIHIDPSPEPYNEQVLLKSGRYLLGENWRDDGDSGQPVVEAMDFDITFKGEDVSDLTLDNLEIRPGGDLWEEFLYGIYLTYSDFDIHSENVTIQYCTFTGDRVHSGDESGDEVMCCEIHCSDNFVFQYNDIHDVYVGSDTGGYFGGLHVDYCDGVTVKGNRIHDCVPKNSYLGMHIWFSEQPVLVEDNEVGPIHNSDSPNGFTIGWGINVIGYSDVTVRHNIVHDMGLPGHRLETVGLFFRSMGYGTQTNWLIENNLIYNLYAQDADNTSSSEDCRGIMFRLNSDNNLDGLVIRNNTIAGLTSGEYVTGLEFDIGTSNYLYNYTIDNNILVDLTGPPVPDDYETSAAVLCWWPGDDLAIDYTLFDDIVIPDPVFEGVILGSGVIQDQDPVFLPDYHFPIDSPAQLGNPNFVDFDDSGPPSGDPGNFDPESRSRMGAFGGPFGDW